MKSRGLNTFGSKPISFFSVVSVMELWNQLSKAFLVNAGIQPPAYVTSKPVIAAHEQPSKKTVPKEVMHIISDNQVELLSEGTLRQTFGFRSLDPAALVLRIARTMDSRLQNNTNMDKFYELLLEVSKASLNSHSFAGKTVISVEGLESSGKTTLISSIAKGCPDLQVFNENSNAVVSAVSEIFLSLPEPIMKAFQFAANYITAYDIVRSEYKVFIIESYHHAVCARNVCEKVLSEGEVAELPGAVFEWPYDLPLPELVLFLSIPTPARLKRMQAAYAENINISPAGRLSAGDSTGQDVSSSRESGQSRDSRGPRFSSSTINERSGTRIVARDARANLVYSRVRGPGTVGLDASAAPAEVLTTALEALDYYGVYNISREYDPYYVAPIAVAPAPAPAPAPVSAPSAVQEVRAAQGSTQDQRSPLGERTSSTVTVNNGTGTATKKARNSRRSSIGPGMKKPVYSETMYSENNIGAFSPENDNPQMFPELPEELIASRRVSMGVYGMFTKL